MAFRKMSNDSILLLTKKKKKKGNDWKREFSFLFLFFFFYFHVFRMYKVLRFRTKFSCFVEIFSTCSILVHRMLDTKFDFVTETWSIVRRSSSYSAIRHRRPVNPSNLTRWHCSVCQWQMLVSLIPLKSSF